MFSIIQQKFGSFSLYQLTDSEKTAFLSFIPNFGATIIDLRLKIKERTVPILQGFRTEKELLANEKSRNIHLLPFPNRIKDGCYAFEGKKHQLPINKPKENNAIHGFIWNRSFDLTDVQCANSKAIATLECDYPGNFDGYPFHFKVRYQYELVQNRLIIKLVVRNSGRNPMPLGAGWHPYFTFNKKVDKLQLQLPACNRLATDERLIPDGRRSQYSEFQSLKALGNISFDDAMELEGDKPHESKLYDPDSDYCVIIQQDAVFRYLQIYIPADRNSIALEPMTCPANAFNSRENLITLKPGESFEGTMKVTVL